MGLFRFLFGEKKGKSHNTNRVASNGKSGFSPDEAIVVNSIPEEYQWMQQNYPGYTPEMQALQFIDEIAYDVLTWSNPNGETVSIYFDISRFYGE